ncbi:MAG TPA: MFS transporter [Thermoleophilaceae bacterium]|nr:MFS transporter [Thermoleophilaceae bacterium]
MTTPATTNRLKSATAARGTSDARIWPAFIVLVLAMLPAVLDQTVLATALPTIAGDLGTLADVSYLVTAYVLASTVATPLWGKLGDRHGRRPLLTAALSLFLVASAACGIAQTLGQLIAARGVQGLAAGGLMALAMASVGDLVDPRERPRWQGRIAAAFSAAAVAGPLIGGLLVDHASWRWVFYVNLPVGLVALVGIRAKLPRGTTPHAERAPLDVLGAGLIALASGSALLVLSLGGHQLDWGSAAVLGLGAIAVIGTAAFALRERRAQDPLVPLTMLGAPAVRVASAGMFLVTAALFGVTVFIPVLLQASAGFSPTQAGLLLATATIGLTVSTTVAGRRIARGGRMRRLPVVGAAVMAAALVGLALNAPSASTGVVIAGLATFGAGFGLTTQLLVAAVQNSVPRTQIGVATATTTFFRAFGGATGAATLGAVFAAGGQDVGDAIQIALFVAAAIAAAAALVLTALPRSVDAEVGLTP